MRWVNLYSAAPQLPFVTTAPNGSYKIASAYMITADHLACSLVKSKQLLHEVCMPCKCRVLHDVASLRLKDFNLICLRHLFTKV